LVIPRFRDFVIDFVIEGLHSTVPHFQIAKSPNYKIAK